MNDHFVTRIIIVINFMYISEFINAANVPRRSWNREFCHQNHYCY